MVKFEDHFTQADFDLVFGSCGTLIQPTPDNKVRYFFLLFLNPISTLSLDDRALAFPGPAGPLLWHWENNTTNDPSVELTLDEVKAINGLTPQFLLALRYLFTPQDAALHVVFKPSFLDPPNTLDELVVGPTNSVYMVRLVIIVLR